MAPRRFFHISKVDLGQTVTLQPKHPDSCGPHEHPDPRVCFAPTLWQCVHSTVGSKDGPSYFEVFTEYLWRLKPDKQFPRSHVINPTIYVTQKRLQKATAGVSDFDYTDEHWSFAPIEVHRFGYIDLYKMLFKHTIAVTTNPRAPIDVDMRSVVETMFTARARFLKPKSSKAKATSKTPAKRPTSPKVKTKA